MTRIVIAKATTGEQTEVDQATFNAGYFPGWVYVKDASGGPSTNPLTPLAVDMDQVLGDPTSAPSVRLRAAYVAPLPTAGSLTYNGDGTIASDPDGNTYTWNTDGTPATQTKGGVTRTFHWNTDGTLASVS